MPRRPTGRIRDPTDPKAPRAPDAEGSGTRHDLVRRALSNDSTLRSLSVHYAADPLNLFLRQLHRLPNVRGFIEERPYPRWVVERATHGPREGRSLGELAEWRALTQQWHRIEREGDAYAESLLATAGIRDSSTVGRGSRAGPPAPVAQSLASPDVAQANELRAVPAADSATGARRA